MKVLAYVSKYSSPAYHRITLPLTLINLCEVSVRNDLHTSHLEGINIFVYNRILPEFALSHLYQLRKKYGFKIGVDVDDFWHLDETHVYKKEYKERDFAHNQTEQLINADFVTVTHERLLGAVRPYNKNVHILPNAIPQYGQYIGVKKVAHPQNLIRLFWQGSNTHLPDMYELKDCLERLRQSEYSKFVEMVVGGYVEEEIIWNKIAALYTCNGVLKHSLIGPMDYESYYYMYQEADICLVPLKKSLFSGMKSNLKVLEAANLKLPVIASNVNPYLKMPIRYASSPANWYLHIRDLVMNKSKRIDEGEKLYEYCKTNYDFNKINEERKQIYEFYNLK